MDMGGQLSKVCQGIGGKRGNLFCGGPPAVNIEDDFGGS